MAVVNPTASAASPHAVSETQCNECHLLGQKTASDAEYAKFPAVLRSQASPRLGDESVQHREQGRLGCVTCHDPHAPARSTSTANTRRNVFSATLRPSRHAPPGLTETKSVAVAAASTSESNSVVCPVGAKKGCLGCHMPRIRAEAIHADVTDHYIRVRRGSREPLIGRVEATVKARVASLSSAQLALGHPVDPLEHETV